MKKLKSIEDKDKDIKLRTLNQNKTCGERRYIWVYAPSLSSAILTHSHITRLYILTHLFCDMRLFFFFVFIITQEFCQADFGFQVTLEISRKWFSLTCMQGCVLVSHMHARMCPCLSHACKDVSKNFSKLTRINKFVLVFCWLIFVSNLFFSSAKNCFMWQTTSFLQPCLRASPITRHPTIFTVWYAPTILQLYHQI